LVVAAILFADASELVSETAEVADGATARRAYGAVEPSSALDEFHQRNVMGICRGRADLGDLAIAAMHRDDLL